jgi:glycerol-3-phosphate dehydrogenase
MLQSARTLLARGECVLIFPEGTRTRPGGLARPKRGIGRLALETGAPIVPVAIHGTDAIRRGWRIRPHRVSVRAGRPLTFPRVDRPSPALAQAVTDRVWPCVQLQWEWLGGLPPLRRAAVIGAGSWGTALAAALDGAGLEVELGARTRAQADAIGASGRNERYLPGVPLAGVSVTTADALDLERADVVLFAVPARALPAAVAAHAGRIPPGAGVVVLSKGLVPPLGTLPSAFVAERVRTTRVACLGGPAHAADALVHGASVVAASTDPAFAAQLTRALADAGLEARRSADVTGVELAGVAKDAAVLAAAAAAPAGPNAAGAAAGQVFAELAAHAHRLGARPESFAGLAGTGDLVAGVLAGHSGSRRAGELLAGGMPPAEIEPALGRCPEALETLPLLAARLAADPSGGGPAVRALAAVVEGREDPRRWAAGLVRAA